jgi:hypothetical protein
MACANTTGEGYRSGTRDLIRSIGGRNDRLASVLDRHSYRVVIETLSKPKFGVFRIGCRKKIRKKLL